MKRHPRGRSFEEVTEKHGDHWRRVAVIRCRHCGEHENLNLKMGASLLPPAAIEKKFTQKGWDVGSNENWDTCPDCVQKAASKPSLKIVHQQNELPAKEVEVKTEPKLVVNADAPRVMQRDDRRIIFEKLNGVYLDEKRGYDPEWSDHKVATDLGVPRARVEQVREEMFGPVNTNADIEAFRKGVEELRVFKDGLKSVEAVRKQIEEIRAIVGGLNIPSILDRVAKLEKLEASIKKHIP